MALKSTFCCEKQAYNGNDYVTIGTYFANHLVLLERGKGKLCLPIVIWPAVLAVLSGTKYLKMYFSSWGNLEFLTFSLSTTIYLKFLLSQPSESTD